MGLTINYSLKCDAENPEIAMEKLSKLHEIAKDLPFAEVSEIIEVNEDDYLTETKDFSDFKSWIKVMSYKYVDTDDGSYYKIAPEKAIAFNVWPGEGCESATFGLAIYPKENESDRHSWSWSSFCKTQYASNPEYGGIEHFVKCHLSIIKLLDEAKKMDMIYRVSDEGGYWKKRNLQELISCVEEYNTLVAAVVGGLGDIFGQASHVESYSPISEFPNFEYLEAEGMQQMDDKDE